MIKHLFFLLPRESRFHHFKGSFVEKLNEPILRDGRNFVAHLILLVFKFNFSSFTPMYGSFFFL